MKSISYGDQGEEVRQIQSLLNGFGYNLEVDGFYGPLTQQAIMDFQRRSGLAADGVVGKHTWEALNAPATYAGNNAGNNTGAGNSIGSNGNNSSAPRATNNSPQTRQVSSLKPNWLLLGLCIAAIFLFVGGAGNAKKT